jgi:hypothetical protein
MSTNSGGLSDPLVALLSAASMLLDKPAAAVRNSNKINHVEEALSLPKNFLDKNNIEQIEAKTQIMIVPGYKFNFISGLITNFHQPKSTLLLLISAFVGENWKKIYNFALNNNFRFLSYGDSSLLIP